MNFEEKLVKEYPLNIKIESDLSCYLLAKGRYLVFWNELIGEETIESVLKAIEQKTNNCNFSNWKTFIVVGKTKEEFDKSDLFYFNSVNTFVVFYLINEEKNKVFMNDSWIFVLGSNYKKYVRKIHKIITQRY